MQGVLVDLFPVWAGKVSGMVAPKHPKSGFGVNSLLVREGNSISFAAPCGCKS